MTSNDHNPRHLLRPAEHFIHADGRIVVIDAWVCALLNKLSLDKIRPQIRGQNAQLDQVLMAIRLVGLAYNQSSSVGTSSAPREEPVSQSKAQLNGTLGTTEAATLLHMTRRAVSKECKQKRLPATLIGGRYRITRDDLAAFMADRI
jgi:excisionase family DNA binding protein